MVDTNLEKLIQYVKKVSKPHPWHGIQAMPEKVNDFSIVNAYIEIVPNDTVKYELDKSSGYLTIDRPHKMSNMMPCLYGFVPQTFCDESVAQHSRQILGDQSIKGDGDPLDICVLTERCINHGNIFVQAKVIGGLRMLDGGEADDKIIAVLKDDHVFGSFKDVSEIPEPVLTRLRHYFLTYKEIPRQGEKPKVEITHVYGREEALKVCQLSHQDYDLKFGYNRILD
jgi:inorganic pyrophosphatase